MCKEEVLVKYIDFSKVFPAVLINFLIKKKKKYNLMKLPKIKLCFCLNK